MGRYYTEYRKYRYCTGTFGTGTVGTPKIRVPKGTESTGTTKTRVPKSTENTGIQKLGTGTIKPNFFAIFRCRVQSINIQFAQCNCT